MATVERKPSNDALPEQSREMFYMTGNDSCTGLKKLSNPTILEETFYILSKRNTIFKVRLDRHGLSLVKETTNTVKEQLISIKDIIGCRCLRSKKTALTSGSCTCRPLRSQPLRVVEENSRELDESDTSAYLYVYAYVMKQKNRETTRREKTTITLRFRTYDAYDDNIREAQKWRTAIKALIENNNTFALNHVTSDNRKILILLNPKSGPGKGRELFNEKVVPVLTEAEVQYDLIVTKYAQFAREFLRDRDSLSEWRGIVGMGGDGVLYEIVNGLLERPDWERVLQTIPLGIIPSGSGNGLARTISYFYDEPYAPHPILSSVLGIVKRKTAPMDLIRVETTSQILFSFLSIGWGLIADIDIESERLRAIGDQRFTIWCFARLIDLRRYGGRVHYLPAGLRRTRSSIHVNHCDTSDVSNCDNQIYKPCNGDNMSFTETPRKRVDSWYSVKSPARQSTYLSAQTDSPSQYKSTNGDDIRSMSVPIKYGPASQLPALTAEVPPNWVTVPGPFVFVQAVYQTHISADCMFSPRSRLDDGIIWLCIMKATASRKQILNFMLGLSSGNHLPETRSDTFMMVPVQAFRIEPEANTDGIITVDGEKVDYGPLQAETFRGIANVMVP